MSNKMKTFTGVTGVALAGAAAAIGAKAFAVPAAKIRRMEMLPPEGPSSKHYDKLPDADTIYGYAADLVDMGARLPGTEAGTKAQDYVIKKFEEFGLEDIGLIPAKTKLYRCNEHSLSVNGEELGCCFINYTGIDGYGDFDSDITDAQLVYVGDDTDSDVDVEGKIVVCDVHFSSMPLGISRAVGMMYDPNKTYGLLEVQKNIYMGKSFTDGYFNYLSRGAAGYVGILVDYYDTPEYLSEDYSYLGDMKLPGVWLSHSTGDQLRKQILDAQKEGKTIKASMRLAGILQQVNSGGIVGFVRGKSDQTILVHSHYDSVTCGASEDASGTAAVLALAEMYAKVPEDELEKTIAFLLIDSHFSDYDTHDAAVEELMEGQGNNGGNIIADLCIEHICDEYKKNDEGGISPTGQIESRIVFTTKGKMLNRIVQEEFIRHRMDRTLFLPANLLGDDLCTDADMFYQEGIEVCSMVSGPIYLYSSDDTLDKIPKDQLVPTCRTFSDILWRLMNEPRLENDK